jgi:hypothetical protein
MTIRMMSDLVGRIPRQSTALALILGLKLLSNDVNIGLRFSLELAWQFASSSFRHSPKQPCAECCPFQQQVSQVTIENKSRDTSLSVHFVFSSFFGTQSPECITACSKSSDISSSSSSLECLLIDILRLIAACS